MRRRAPHASVARLRTLQALASGKHGLAKGGRVLYESRSLN